MCIFTLFEIGSLAHRLLRSVSQFLRVWRFSRQLSVLDFCDSMMVRECTLDGFSSCTFVEVCFMTQNMGCLGVCSAGLCRWITHGYLGKQCVLLFGVFCVCWLLSRVMVVLRSVSLLMFLFSSSVLAESEAFKSPTGIVHFSFRSVGFASCVLRVCCVAGRHSGWLCPPDGLLFLCVRSLLVSSNFLCSAVCFSSCFYIATLFNECFHGMCLPSFGLCC